MTALLGAAHVLTLQFSHVHREETKSDEFAGG
jgi:hypothetical protein